MKTALITGAGSKNGIGRAVALYMAEKGYNIAVADLDAAGVEMVAEEIRSMGRRAVGIQVNVADETSVQNMVESAVNALDAVHILVNCAGITQPVTVLNTSLSDWNRIMSVNLTGTFLCSKAVLPGMKAQKFGRIINVSSVSAKRGGGVFGGAHYSASKAGVLGFSKALARECAMDGITVNSVCPGLIATDIRKGLSDEQERASWKTIPMERPGSAKEVASAIAYLASDDAAYITGEEIDINGGSHID